MIINGGGLVLNQQHTVQSLYIGTRTFAERFLKKTGIQYTQQLDTSKKTVNDNSATIAIYVCRKLHVPNGGTEAAIDDR